VNRRIVEILRAMSVPLDRRRPPVLPTERASTPEVGVE
jgi:hypothetical protein